MARLDPRQRRLLVWLHSPDANCMDLVPWLAGKWMLYVQEDPTLALMRSLPSVDCRVEPVVRRVFARRLALLVTRVAADRNERAKLSTLVWGQVLSLIKRLNDRDVFARPLRDLLGAFDGDGFPAAFRDDDTLPRRFTEMLVYNQEDSSLDARWLKLIEKKEGDPILRCDMFAAIRGLLSTPERVANETIERMLNLACARIDRALAKDALKTERAADLLSMIERDYPRSTVATLCSLVPLWDRFPWVPTDHSILDVQRDNTVEERWVHGVLDASGTGLSTRRVGSIRGLLALPDYGLVKYALLEQCVQTICDQIEKEQRKTQGKVASLKSVFWDAIRDASRKDRAQRLFLAFARLWGDYPWLPTPHPFLYAIAVIRDLAVLANLTRGLRTAGSWLAQYSELMRSILAKEDFLIRKIEDADFSEGGRLLRGVPVGRGDFSRSEMRPSARPLPGSVLGVYIAQCLLDSPQMAERLLQMDAFYDFCGQYHHADPDSISRAWQEYWAATSRTPIVLQHPLREVGRKVRGGTEVWTLNTLPKAAAA